MMRILLPLLLVACGASQLDAPLLDGAADSPADSPIEARTDAGVVDEAEPACNPCHGCPADDLGRPRYCDDMGVCRLELVCVAPNPPFDAGDPRCAPWDAVGVGDACSTVLGWAYDGSRCYRVIGCACEGADCGHIYNDALPCGFDHGPCPHGLADGGQ